jgi:hypothetical protein
VRASGVARLVGSSGSGVCGRVSWLRRGRRHGQAMPEMPARESIRVAEVLGALSLTTDLGSGLPFEKGLRTCVLAGALADALDLGFDERRTVFHAALLRAIGCTAHAPENAAMFLDDMMFQRAPPFPTPARARCRTRRGRRGPSPSAAHGRTASSCRS